MFQARLIFFSIVFILVNTSLNAQKTSFKVMAWNILHGGNDIENGQENVAKIIKEINPDVILMVETYGSGPYAFDNIKKLLLIILRDFWEPPEFALCLTVGPLFSTPFAEFIADACDLLTDDGNDAKRLYPDLPPPTLPCVKDLYGIYNLLR